MVSHMKQTLSVIFAFYVLAGAAYGENISVPGVGIFSNYVVRRVEPDGITIKHSRGLTKLFFSELPAEICAKYGANSAKAAEYRRENARAQAQRDAELAGFYARRQQEWMEHAAHLRTSEQKSPNDTTSMGDWRLFSNDRGLFTKDRVFYPVEPIQKGGTRDGLFTKDRMTIRPSTRDYEDEADGLVENDTLDDTFTHFGNDNIYPLKNEHVWQQVDYEYELAPKSMVFPQVIIYKDGDQYWMRIKGIKKVVEVIRIR